MLEAALTLPIAIALGLGVLAWLSSVALLAVGAALRKGRSRGAYAIAALVQLVAPPIALVAGLLALRDFAAMFGAEGMALVWMLRLAPAWLVLGLAAATTAGITALVPRRSEPPPVR